MSLNDLKRKNSILKIDLNNIPEVPKTNKVPIYRGCPNKECFCSGACREIIGWRDKIFGEF